MTSTDFPASGRASADDAQPKQADPMAERAADIAADDPDHTEVAPGAAAVEPAPIKRTPVAVARGVVRTMRPKQWVKNILVLAAPFAGGVLFSGGLALHLAVAFVAFSLAASGIYLVNDANDVAADRAHPTKRRRPIAAGIVPVKLAFAVAAVLLAAAIAISLLASAQLTVVVGVYVAVQLAYCFWLKHQPVLDICIVASGFLLRAVAGGAATGIPLSQWFLLSAGFGSLFMVAGKREAEVALLGQDGETRAVLGAYTPAFLRHVRTVASGVAMTAYCLWAFERAQGSAGAIWFELSIVPFVLGVLRYALIVDSGGGAAPEEIVLGDRMLQLMGVIWAVIVAVGLYVA